jgi:hypothetical protein
MKKTLLYLLAAAVLGILVTVVPLITVAQIGIESNKQNEPQARSLGQGLRQLEGGDGSNSSDVAVLAISFFIALLAYALVGHRAPRRYNMRLGVPPY